jgi:hypothetical protein
MRWFTCIRAFRAYRQLILKGQVFVSEVPWVDLPMPDPNSNIFDYWKEIEPMPRGES